jgi:hypothetical protein
MHNSLFTCTHAHIDEDMHTHRKRAVYYSLEWDELEKPQPTSDEAKWSHYSVFEQHIQLHETQHEKSEN